MLILILILKYILSSSNQRFFCDNSTEIHNSCAQMACECDVYFVNRVFEHLMKFEPSISIMNGFNREDECVSGYGSFEEKDKCCGTYPDRFPFSSRDGNRGCCNTRTYDTSIMECCEDGQLRFI